MSLEQLRLHKQDVRIREEHSARRHLLLVEKREVIDSFHRGVVSQSACEKLLADIDVRLLQIQLGEANSASDKIVKLQTDGQTDVKMNSSE